MTQQRTKRTLIGVLALVALFALTCGSAFANTTADTDIVNVVHVAYTDASGNNSFDAEASATVTVNLVPSALTASAAPTDVTANPGLVCDTTDYASGATAQMLYALTATANGDDLYDMAIADDGTGDNATNITLAYAILDYEGTQVAASPITDYTLGSAVIVGHDGANTLYFPGGALAGFSVDDIVVVDGVSYLVSAVSVGVARSHTNDDQTQSYADEGTETTETQGSLTLVGYTQQTILGTTVGGSATPTFTDAVLGELAAEQVLIRIDVTASAGPDAATDGTVDYTFTVTDSDGNPETISCTVTFTGTELEIQKEARVSADGGTTWTGWGAAAGNPGDLIEYRVTITNAEGTAANVVVTDAVPAYTTLVNFSDSYDGTIDVASPGDATDIFAQISDGTNDVEVTMGSGDSETQAGAPTETGFGNATGTAAGQDITFYIGDTSTNAAGGTVANSATYTILYQVTID